MLRAALVIFLNEFRLLVRDRVGIVMLILAPVVIIAVAGFSLGNIYGARPSGQSYVVAVVDLDRGAVARAVIDGLTHDRSIDVLPMADRAQALRTVGERDHAPIAIVIPNGITKTFEDGRSGRLELYIDPVKRIEVDLLELRLNELCWEITTRAQALARRKLASRTAETRARLERLVAQVQQAQAATDRYRREFLHGRARATAELQDQVQHVKDDLEKEMEVQIDQLAAQRRAALGEVTSRRNALLELRRYLDSLQASQHEFDQWFRALQAAASSHRVDLPSPPAFPAPPTSEQLAEWFKAPELPVLQVASLAPPAISLKLPDLPPIPRFDLPQDWGSITPGVGPVFPGDLDWKERTLTGARAEANAFDQYVPGFGITFLFIAMLLAIGLGLIDERDWGTLQRLQISGAPLVAVIIGKLFARSLVGLSQMIVLFGVGWLIFDISLGRNPLMLLVPTAAISFAAATISLLVACVARTHDSVMPVGATIAMALSAIGGCWWPIDFEPTWMRAIARWLPTTWTMRAYNDLMIRHLEASSALWPALVTVGLALLYLVIGMFAASKLYE
jgi:ABC-type multidrug transport system permease subunit